MYLLARWPEGPERLWEQLASGAFRLADLSEQDVPRMRELMAKYRDLPMDLADAALVRVAERERISTIFTDRPPRLRPLPAQGLPAVPHHSLRCGGRGVVSQDQRPPKR